jgi:CRISPR-associated protein Csm3
LIKHGKKTPRKTGGLLQRSSQKIASIRIKGTAANPRFIERVPEGTKFRLLITFKILQAGDEQLFADYLLKGLKLIEIDALGGSGSRGYGRVELEFNDKAINDVYRNVILFKEV